MPKEEEEEVREAEEVSNEEESTDSESVYGEKTTKEERK